MRQQLQDIMRFQLKQYLCLLFFLVMLQVSNKANAQSVQYTDTASMLAPYLRSALGMKYTDTALMLSRYLRSNLGVKYADTSAMLSRYLKIGDTTRLLSPYLRSALGMKYADTALMLSRYVRATAGVKYADTALMLSRYFRVTDTSRILSPYLRNALGVKYTDTASMLSQYARRSELPNMAAKLNTTDTSNMLSGYAKRTELPDVSTKLNYTDTTALLAGYVRRANLPDMAVKLNTADTVSMLSSYARKTELPNINGKLNVSDTASMLSSYLRSTAGMKYTDTSTMLMPYMLKSESSKFIFASALSDTVSTIRDLLRTGISASGTWGINITGNAATATTAENWSGSSALSNYLPLSGGTLTGNLSGRAVFLNKGLSIGTADSSEALVVNGSIKTKKITVTQLGWSDYVFDNAYKLRPIDEVEAYIKKHKHLPDVPSAAIVEKNGVEMGESIATLLRKVEELTLYVIQLKKENQEQNKLIAALKKRQIKKK